MNEYWAERMAKSQEAIAKKHIKEIEKQMARYYQQAMERTIADFEATYDKLFRGFRDGVNPTPADLYKLDRYWQMQAQLRKELEKLGDKQNVLLSKAFERTWYDIYNSIDLPSTATFNSVDGGVVKQLINEIWVADGKSFSQRIWENTQELVETLNDELVHCVTTGKSTNELKQKLVDRFGVSYSNADMLVHTETAHIQTQAARKRYEDYGVKEVEVWADKDERRCDVCGKLHQKRYPVGAVMPVPAHPRCRCCIVPVVSDNLTSTDKDDIIIGRSLGASARNYPVKAPDSNQHYKFAEGTSITKIKVIMGHGTNKPLNNKHTIALRNNISNPDSIQKLRGEGYVMVEGKKRKAELHWYEADEIDRFEFKVKRYLDES